MAPGSLRAALGLALAIFLGGVSQSASSPREAPAPQPPGAASSSEQHVTVSGTFHVIWNGEQKYMLIDDQGLWTRLLLDEPSIRRLGGPLAMNRKRVTVVGVPLASPAGAIRVVHIALE